MFLWSGCSTNKDNVGVIILHSWYQDERLFSNHWLITRRLLNILHQILNRRLLNRKDTTREGGQCLFNRMIEICFIYKELRLCDNDEGLHTHHLSEIVLPSTSRMDTTISEMAISP